MSMDNSRFDALARAMASGTSRRAIFSLSFGAGLAVSLWEPARGKGRLCRIGCGNCQQCVKQKCRKRRKHSLCGKRICAPLDDGTACPGGACRDGACVPAGGSPPPVGGAPPSHEQCNSGQMSCAGDCVDLTRDEVNCGACGHSCDADAECQDGVCVCNPGTTDCGDECANLLTDPHHCGECGFACATGQACVHGTCSCDPFNNTCPTEVDGQCGCSATVATPFVAACTDRNSACDLAKPCTSNDDCPPRSVCLQGCADTGNRNRCSTPCIPV